MQNTLKTPCPSCKVPVETNAVLLEKHTQLGIKCHNCKTVFNLQVTVLTDTKEREDTALQRSLFKD